MRFGAWGHSRCLKLPYIPFPSFISSTKSQRIWVQDPIPRAVFTPGSRDFLSSLGREVGQLCLSKSPHLHTSGVPHRSCALTPWVDIGPRQPISGKDWSGKATAVTAPGKKWSLSQSHIAHFHANTSTLTEWLIYQLIDTDDRLTDIKTCTYPRALDSFQETNAT
jgi:hypothetical protein